MGCGLSFHETCRQTCKHQTWTQYKWSLAWGKHNNEGMICQARQRCERCTRSVYLPNNHFQFTLLAFRTPMAAFTFRSMRAVLPEHHSLFFRASLSQGGRKHWCEHDPFARTINVCTHLTIQDIYVIRGMFLCLLNQSSHDEHPRNNCGDLHWVHKHNWSQRAHLQCSDLSTFNQMQFAQVNNVHANFLTSTTCRSG